MTSPAAFRDRTNWSEGYYELAIEVGSNDDARIQAVLSALWSAADVHGCFGRRDREPEEQDPVPCTVDSLAEFGHLGGRVRLPTGHLTVCGCVAIRGGDESSDWPSFSLGVIGFEVSGCTDASAPAGRMPKTRDIGYLLPRGGVLHYGAANT
ncbi:hypothetical protein ACFW20_14300 [Streptomyces nigra]|uniref:hypothetical protein n=1 Tax=Streptomyces nigra TaxID=1827580 RepID=UPI0036C72D3B